jgi:3-hydroxyacyl-CoA dehydrogenase/enoyl-CoA hydratase/3-hydroxybutyryl-CoA epimerase
VALLKGATLGGGLELALCCRYRVMQESPERSVGVPEVQLGLHPGLGGTVRLVRLIGVRAAMDLMLSGRSLSPVEALKRGLIDEVVPAAELRETAEKLARQQPATKSAPLPDRLLGLAILRPLLAKVLQKQVAVKAKPDQYPAPYAIIDLWQSHGANPATAYDAEAESFADLLATETSKNLVRVFFLQDGLKKEPVAEVAAAERVHVVGAGVMGGDIAAWCALRGCSVTLQDREEKYIQPALTRAAELFSKRLRSPELVAEAMSRLQSDVAGTGVANADVIVEAIFENLEAKQELLKKLEAEMRPEALLTSNTSSIPLEQIAEALQNPSRLVGLHFFNPVAKMPLIEVIRHTTVSETAVLSAVGFARQIGKLPLICKSSPGFLVNRVLGPYLDEAMRLVIDGFAPEDIDKSARNFGMPMGPIELADSVGLDIGLHVAEGLAAITGREVPTKLQEMVANGVLGRKSGEGFYRYADGKTVRSGTTAAANNPEVQARLVYALLNESAYCLHEGVANSADEVDAGVIFGTGFAPFRGGPLHYAQHLGLSTVVAELERLRLSYGERFAPSAGWSHSDLTQ